MNAKIEALECTQKHKELLDRVYDYYVLKIGDGAIKKFKPCKGSAMLFGDIDCSTYNKLLRELVAMGLLCRNRSRNATYTLPDEPASNQKLVSLFVEQTEAIVRDTANISTCIHKDVGKVFEVVESLQQRQLEMEDTLTKVASHVEAISRHIGRNEVRDGNEPAIG